MAVEELPMVPMHVLISCSYKFIPCLEKCSKSIRGTGSVQMSDQFNLFTCELWNISAKAAQWADDLALYYRSRL